MAETWGLRRRQTKVADGCHEGKGLSCGVKEQERWKQRGEWLDGESCSRSCRQTAFCVKIRLKVWSFVLILEQEGRSQHTRKSVNHFHSEMFPEGTSSPRASLTWHVEQCQSPKHPDTRCWGKGGPWRRAYLLNGPNLLSQEGRPTTPFRNEQGLQSSMSCISAPSRPDLPTHSTFKTRERPHRCNFHLGPLGWDPQTAWLKQGMSLADPVFYSTVPATVSEQDCILPRFEASYHVNHLYNLS